MKKLFFSSAILSALLFSVSAGCNHPEEKETTIRPSDSQSVYQKLVWSEEFNYTGKPDPEKWGYELGKVRNSENQFYTSDSANARVEMGCLVIEAHRFAEEDSITSASIISLNKKHFGFGRMEVCAQVPLNSRGSWPAIWMMGVNRATVGWPECGEIDIMEHVGYYEVMFYSAIHSPGSAANEVPDYPRKGAREESKPGDFHIYAMERDANQIRIYMDNNLMLTYDKDEKHPAYWRFSGDFYLLLNMAVGGEWGGAHGIDNDAFPYQYKVNWVRFFE